MGIPRAVTVRKPWMMALGGVMLAVLAGCQTPGGTSPSAAPPAAAAAEPAQPATQPGTEPGATHTITENRQAMDLRVFLADTHAQAGWTPVSLKPSGMLYVQPAAVIDRSDLMGIQSATDSQGGGVLVLILSDEGLRKMHDATAAHPGMRLALVVGQTMLAAPGYAGPVNQQKLAFGVGSPRNAELAARSVAGVPTTPATN